MKARGPIGKLARLYNRAAELRLRWRRTPKSKRRELIADLADVLRSKAIQTGTRRQPPAPNERD